MADRADGSVVIRVVAEADEAEKQLNKLKKKISETEKSIESMGDRTALDKTLSDLGLQLDLAANKLREMKAASKGAFSAEQIAEQAETVKSLQSRFNEADRAVIAYDKKLAAATQKLNQQKTEAGELVQKINAVTPGMRAMAAAQEGAEKSAQRFGMRIREVVRSALVFTLITQALAKFREWMGAVIKTNAEANESVARLKGALLTLAQPLIDILLPAFVTLVNLLTAMVGRLAELTAFLGGTTVSNASAAAEAFNEEAEAIEGTGAAAKKSSKMLASFDEINTLSGSGGQAQEMTKPDFSWSTGISERMAEIANSVLLIAAGLAMWKISSDIPGKIGAIWTGIAGLIIAVGGLMLLWQGLSDAWTNGVDWGNLITMLGGVTAAAIGLGLAFGPIGAGIALVVSGIALLITGFHDMMENGMNLQNTLLAIAGIIATGLGITLLTGSLIPLLVAGIAAVLLAIVKLTGNGGQLIDNLKQILEGLTQFVKGVMVDDFESAFEGLKKAAKGVVNGVLTIFGSLVKGIQSGLNWLIKKINAISFTVPGWVPGIGGKSLGFNLPPFKTDWKIPQLAQGAVIPPNREFLAVLGDQTRGNNIEAPEDLIRKIVREESGGMNEELLRAILAAIQAGQTIVMDGEKVARNQVRHINNMSIAAGKPVLIL